MPSRRHINVIEADALEERLRLAEACDPWLRDGDPQKCEHHWHDLTDGFWRCCRCITDDDQTRQITSTAPR